MPRPPPPRAPPLAPPPRPRKPPRAEPPLLLEKAPYFTALGAKAPERLVRRHTPRRRLEFRPLERVKRRTPRSRCSIAAESSPSACRRSDFDWRGRSCALQPAINLLSTATRPSSWSPLCAELRGTCHHCFHRVLPRCATPSIMRLSVPRVLADSVAVASIRPARSARRIDAGLVINSRKPSFSNRPDRPCSRIFRHSVLRTIPRRHPSTFAARPK